MELKIIGEIHMFTSKYLLCFITTHILFKHDLS